MIDVLDRQRAADRGQFDKEFEMLKEAIHTCDATSRSSIDSLLKNTSRVYHTNYSNRKLTYFIYIRFAMLLMKA